MSLVKVPSARCYVFFDEEHGILNVSAPAEEERSKI